MSKKIRTQEKGQEVNASAYRGYRKFRGNYKEMNVEPRAERKEKLSRSGKIRQ